MEVLAASKPSERLLGDESHPFCGQIRCLGLMNPIETERAQLMSAARSRTLPAADVAERS
jgi:hypothetical protein